MINCRQLSVSAIKLSAVVHQCIHTSVIISTFRFTEVTNEVLQLSRDFILHTLPRCPVPFVSIPVLYFRYVHRNEVL